MKRLLSTCTIVLACAVAAGAPDTKINKRTKVKSKTSPVTLTGCLQPGAQTTRFMLEHALPFEQRTTTAIGTSGIPETTTTTTYLLVPGGKIDLRPSPGQ